MNAPVKNEIVTDVKGILEQKCQLLIQYEMVTDKMLSCVSDNLLGFIEDRQDLAEQIDMLDLELKRLYEQFGNELLREAVSNRLNWGDCPAYLGEVFGIGQQMFATISRISRKEEQVVFRVGAQKEELLTLIKEQNSGVSAKASKYYGTVKQSERNISLFDNKY